LHPTVKQTHALSQQLNNQRELYNAALEERIGAWKWERRRVSYVDQCTTLTGLVEVRPEVLVGGVDLCRGTLKRLDRSMPSFAERRKEGRPVSPASSRPRVMTPCSGKTAPAGNSN
jgi:putative transposase